jgi:uncharacterized repeat protein (TIGR03803 family)
MTSNIHLDTATRGKENSGLRSKASSPEPPVDQAGSLSQVRLLESHLRGAYMKHHRNLLSVIAAALLFAVAANAQTYNPLYTYPQTKGNNTGILPPDAMSQGQDGTLYTTDAYNGTHNFGTVFKMTTAGQPTAIYNFCPQTGCLDGGLPMGGVALGFDGNLYGTTQGGGKHAAGTVFKVTPLGTLTTLWTFANGTDDSVPIFALLQAQDGNLYGVSLAQYNGQYGAFYKVSSSGVFSVLHDFTFTDGSNPNLPTAGTDGNFYGTTYLGGSPACAGYQYRCGVVYKLTPNGKDTVLWNFKGFYGNDGALPVGVLVQGYDGNYYGATREGGNSANCGGGCGAVFKITPAGVLTILHNFTGHPDGAYPDTGLTLGTDGNFYGVTSVGGKFNAGALFKITPAGTETILYNFCSVSGCTDGFNPETPLVQHTNGKFYGNTTGNSLGGGVFYSMDMGLKPFAGLVTWTGKVGKTVEILGQGFNGAMSVSFNGVSATFSIVSDTYMTATLPAGALTGFVTVKTLTSTLKSNRQYLVIPQITTLNPTSGVVGSSLTITGVSLTQATKVIIGGKTASFTVNSDTKVTATVPAGAKTGQAISITTAGGTATSSGKLVVVPAISGFSPTSGRVGTSVTITGNSFTGATSVTFGGVAATSYQVVSDTKVTATVPTGAVTGPVAITTPGGTATSATSFTVTP